MTSSIKIYIHFFGCIKIVSADAWVRDRQRRYTPNLNAGVAVDLRAERGQLHTMLGASFQWNGANSVPTWIVAEKKEPLSSWFFGVSCVLPVEE